MRFGDDGRYCYSYVDEAMLAQTGADGEDTEETVNLLRGEGVEVAALFKAYEGEVRVSLAFERARQRAGRGPALGGGGHFRASGLTCEGTLSDAIASVEAALVARGL